MSYEIKVKMKDSDGNETFESLNYYCSRISKKNNSVLYMLEDYLNKKLLDDPKLSEIRDVLLTVSADISKLVNIIHIESDCDERL